MHAYDLPIAYRQLPAHSIERALIEVGVKPSHLRSARLRASHCGEELPTALRNQGLASSERIAKAIALHSKLEYWSFHRLMVNDYSTVRDFTIESPLQGIPIELDKARNRITLAVPSASVEIGGEFLSYTQDLVIASTRALQHAYRRIFAGTENQYRSVALRIAQHEAKASGESESGDYRRMFIALLRHACYIGANDLQLQTSAGVGNVRLVVDGVGTLFDVVSQHTMGKLITIAMRATEKNEDNIKKQVFGEASFDEADLGEDVLAKELKELRGEFDFRLNFGRAKGGETLVTRFLARDTESLEFDQLGIDAEDQETLRDALASNSGLLVITGPTGSSKTTTRFAMLSQIDPEERSIQTIENPVEYTHPLWMQYEISGIEEDESTEKVFRGMLRNAPRVIDIGEVRSKGTAQTMIRAAATGHLVFTTLHADDGPLAIYMLRKLGIDNEDLAANLEIVLGVRLVRRLCGSCRREEDRPEALVHIEALQEECQLEPPGTALFYANETGCAHCTAGYRSRFLIYELLEVRDDVASALRRGASAAEIRQLALKPQRTLRARCLAALHAGHTSIDELIRVSPRRRY